MRIVITKNGKLLVQELEEESPSNLKSKIKSFQSSYSKLPVIYTNEELIKKYSNKRKNNDFIKTLMFQRELSNKKNSNSLIDKRALEIFFSRDDSKIDKNELNRAKKITLSHTKLSIAQNFLDKYDEYDENYKKKFIEFNNLFSNNTKKTEEKNDLNNNIELKSDNVNNSNLNNTNNNNIISPMDSNLGINIINNSSSAFSMNKIKKINIGDIISKKNLYNLRNRMSKYNKGSNDVRIPLDKQNLRSFNFRSKYENKQATEDDMDLILNYGINTDKSSIIRYFKQKKKISPQYFENLLKYDEPQLYKLNKICDIILEKREIEKNKQKMKFYESKEEDKYKNGTNLKDIENIIKKSDSVINDYTVADKSRRYWKLRANKEEADKIKKKYWIRYNVDRFLKNKQKMELKGFSLSTKNGDSKKLFSSQSSPNVFK